MSDDYKRQLAWLLLIAAAVLAAGMGLRDPWPADEPRFALIARDMVESGNWMFPQVGSVLYSDKPPLFFWLVASFYALTGSLRYAFLLPGVIAGLGTLLLVTDLGRRLWGPYTGIWSGAVLLALVQFPLQMKSGQIDGLLCLWTTLGLYGFCRHLLLGPDWRWYAIAGIACGLGVITKGVGFLPYLVFIPYWLARHRGWAVLQPVGRDSRWLLAPLASLLVIAAWLLPMLVVVNASADPELAAYRDNILFHQTVTRYANAWGHLKPPWYLLTNAVPWLWLPATALLPWLVPAWLRDLRKKNAATLILGGWIMLVLLFFSISMGKRSLYIFPAAPAVALLVGQHAESLLKRAGVQRILMLLPALLGISLIGLAMYVLMHPRVVDQWLIEVPLLLRAALSLLAVGLAMLASVVICRRRAVPGFAVSLAAFWVGLSLLVLPALNQSRSGKIITEAVAEQIDPAAPLAFVAWPEQFLLQWPRPAVHFGYRRMPDEEIADAAAWLVNTPDGHVLLPASSAAACFNVSQAIPVGTAHRRDWLLAGPDALNEHCLRPPQANLVVVQYSPTRPPGTQGF